jgi:hypothetical protein
MDGEHVDVLVWTDRGKSNVIARLRGHVKRFDREAVWEPQRALLMEEMQAPGKELDAGSSVRTSHMQAVRPRVVVSDRPDAKV